MQAQQFADAALIAVDWGTSRLRAQLVDASGRPLAQAESSDGIGQVKGGHEPVFERLVAPWPKVPAIMAGMIGSRQGWREAAYLPCPAAVSALAGACLRFATAAGRPMAIVPGMMLKDRLRDADVMRGEETQIAGLMENEPGFSGVVILPGTHSKWTTVENGVIADFQTFLTGELFDLLAHHSFLRHSVAESGAELSAQPDFALALRRTVEDGLPFLSSVFSVRARALVDGVRPEDNLAYLSGLVIGGEIAAARASGRLRPGTPMRIVGTRSLGRAYARAFAAIGAEATVVDGNATALAGLVHLARAIGFLADRSRP